MIWIVISDSDPCGVWDNIRSPFWILETTITASHMGSVCKVLCKWKWSKINKSFLLREVWIRPYYDYPKNCNWILIQQSLKAHGNHLFVEIVFPIKVAYIFLPTLKCVICLFHPSSRQHSWFVCPLWVWPSSTSMNLRTRRWLSAPRPCSGCRVEE